jgi:hypothetical protein
MKGYLVYKTINKITKKEYIGVHKSRIEGFDGYYGSNSELKKDISLLGKDNFSRDVLYCYDNENDAYLKESTLVDKEYIKLDKTYNKQVGGKGGFHGCNTPEATKRSLESVRKVMADRYNGDRAGQLHRPEVYDKIRLTRKNNSVIKYPILNDLCNVHNLIDEVVWSGKLVDLLIEIFGTEMGVSRRGRLIPMIDNSKPLRYKVKPEWKGFIVKWV